jgi:hypothetical protein
MLTYQDHPDQSPAADGLESAMGSPDPKNVSRATSTATKFEEDFLDMVEQRKVSELNALGQNGEHGTITVPG